MLCSLEYSIAPKTGRPVFGVFRCCLVAKHSGFQIGVWKPDVISGFRTSGSMSISWTGRPVFGRFGPNRPKPVRNRFHVYFMNRTSGFRTFWFESTKTGTEPVLNRFGTSETLKRLKTGHYIRFSDDFVWISGETSEIRTFWEPDNFQKRRNPDVRILDIYCT